MSNYNCWKRYKNRTIKVFSTFFVCLGCIGNIILRSMSFLHVLMYIYKKSEKFNSQHIIIILYLYYIWIKKKEFSSTSSVFLKDKLYFIFHLPPSSLPASVSVLQIQHEKNNITWPFWIYYRASWLLCTQRKNGSFIVILDQDCHQTSLCLLENYSKI